MAPPANVLTDLRVDPEAGVDLAEQLRQQIAWLIASRRLDEGERLPPIRRLAGQLGIHMHTVRAAYAQLEAEGLVDSRPGAGTRVRRYDAQRQARHLPNVPTFTVGVILPEYSPFYLPYLRGIEQAAQAERTLVLLSHAHNDSLVAARLLDQLVAKSVDGILLTALPVDLTERLRSHGARPAKLPPVVSVDIPRAEGPSIVLDGKSAGDQAAEHLIQAHGCLRIGLVTAPLSMDNVRQFHDGFAAALSRHGRELQPAWVAETGDFSPEAGQAAAESLLSASPDLDAIVAASDTLAMGVLKATRQRGRRVPEDLAVIGYDDIELAAYLEPPLTTVAAPAFEMGEAAMKLLARLVDSGALDAPRQVLPTRLVVRRSCGCAEP
jgi:LacI family repressor for deo operon, udp, cdd, tsx, nupC, and nupG